MPLRDAFDSGASCLVPARLRATCSKCRAKSAHDARLPVVRPLSASSKSSATADARRRNVRSKTMAGAAALCSATERADHLTFVRGVGTCPERVSRRCGSGGFSPAASAPASAFTSARLPSDSATGLRQCKLIGAPFPTPSFVSRVSEQKHPQLAFPKVRRIPCFCFQYKMRCYSW